MLDLFKFFITFTFSSLFILSISMPQKGVINYSFKDSDPHSAVYASSSLDESDFSKRYVSPIVKITLMSKSPMGDSSHSVATGFSVKYDLVNNVSYIITNDHFCDSKKDLPFDYEFLFEESDNIFSFKGDNYDGSLVIVSRSAERDLCLLKADKKIQPVTLSPEDYKSNIMEKVISIGAPNGVFPIATETYLSGAFERTANMIEGDPLLLLSATVFQGQSGSPVYNRRGEVIGVIFIGFENAKEHIPGSLAIPISDVRIFLKESGI